MVFANRDHLTSEESAFSGRWYMSMLEAKEENLESSNTVVPLRAQMRMLFLVTKMFPIALASIPILTMSLMVAEQVWPFMNLKKRSPLF